MAMAYSLDKDGMKALMKAAGVPDADVAAVDLDSLRQEGLERARRLLGGGC
jgi:hypothetical protein